MRTIKFRGKDQQGEWLHGDLIHNRGKVYIAPIGKTYIDFSADDFEIDEETVGQYTGLKDKNGVEIYEGDVVEWSNCVADGCYQKYRQAVYYDYEGFQPISDEATSISDNLYSYKVIGNIYDNPELIKEE